MIITRQLLLMLNAQKCATESCAGLDALEASSCRYSLAMLFRKVFMSTVYMEWAILVERYQLNAASVYKT